MAKKSHNKRHKGHKRGRRGGALAPLSYGPANDSPSPEWKASASGGLPAAAIASKSFLQQITGSNTGVAASKALNDYALNGVGQSGSQSGGGSRRRRHGKIGTRRRRGGMTQAQGEAKAQTGGMFATFGALLKEALVPLGLLAVQQTYGKTYGKKHRSSGAHTRKHRR